MARRKRFGVTSGRAVASEFVGEEHGKRAGTSDMSPIRTLHWEDRDEFKPSKRHRKAPKLHSYEVTTVVFRFQGLPLAPRAARLRVVSCPWLSLSSLAGTAAR